VNVRTLTSTPVKSCAAAAAEADAAGAETAGADAAVDGATADGVGLADEPHAVRTRMGTIAAAIERNRDTWLLLLTHLPSSNILNTRR
jgi:hypothetical protein